MATTVQPARGWGPGRRGYPLESVVARICREAGGRVTTNVLVRDLDLTEPNAADALRLEVVADGLPLFGGFRARGWYPKLVGRRGRARLVVLAVEVCGRWSQETQRFLSSLARAESRSVPPLLRKRVEQAWRLRWGSLFSCTVARAVGSSLRGGLCLASHEVERDFRHAGLDP